MQRGMAGIHEGERQLSLSKFFAGVALRALVFDLKQVGRYLREPELRCAARARVTVLIGPETRVVVAHSLGSVVAYEALCAVPGHPVRALVTLGSPLGIRNLVFDRLDPAPRGGQGQWPGSEGLMWTNVADGGDVVALEKDLRSGSRSGAQRAGSQWCARPRRHVRIWDLSTDTLRTTLIGHTDLVRAVACTTLDGQPVAITTSDDQTVRIWDLTTTTELAVFDYAGSIGALCIGPAQEIVIGTGWDLVVLDRRPSG